MMTTFRHLLLPYYVVLVEPNYRGGSAGLYEMCNRHQHRIGSFFTMRKLTSKQAASPAPSSQGIGTTDSHVLTQFAVTIENSQTACEFPR